MVTCSPGGAPWRSRIRPTARSTSPSRATSPQAWSPAVADPAGLEDLVDEDAETVDVVQHHPVQLPALRLGQGATVEGLDAELERRERAFSSWVTESMKRT